MSVETSDNIELNGKRYTIKGGVTGAWLDPFPEQQSIGDPSYSNRKNLSSWTINDLRGGIGVEEMDEVKDWNKCWWTNCIIRHRNHILPPRLAVEVTTPTHTTPTITDADMEAGSASWVLEDGFDGVQVHGGAQSINVVIENTSQEIHQDLSGYKGGIEYTFTCWVYATGTNFTGKVGINDGVGTTYGSTTTTATTWIQLTVTRTLDINPTRLRILMHAENTGGGNTVYWDDAALSHTAIAVGTSPLFANFNGELYAAFGTLIGKLNSGRTAFDLVADMGTTITALIPSLNSRLYIYIGDTANYHYMSTAEAFTETALDLEDLTADATTDTDTIVDSDLSGKSIVPGDYVYNTTRSAGAIVQSFSSTTIELESTIAAQTNGDTYSVRRGGSWGFQHDAKLFRVTADGNTMYSTDPDATSPTWTTGGAITDIASQIEGFFVGRDAAGNYVPYGATNSVLKAYDAATPQWLDTEAKLPNHPIGGKGHAYWNGKHYLSYGLACKEYYPETGSFLDMGLTERDGLPVEYNGEITKLLGDTGVKGMFASVDASVTSGNSKSGLYLYDGEGWQCWWIDTSNNGAMTDIIVSSASSGYAVYWDVGGKVYYIDIPRGIENPDKITQSYATAGIFMSPWFDAGNPTAKKLAKLLTNFASGVTTGQTVALKYRIDYANTDLTTGWTTLDTLNTTGEDGYNEELWAAGAGLAYRAIQFGLDFVTTGSTSKADIKNLVFYYKKRTGSVKKRMWRAQIICDKLWGTGAREKAQAIKAAIEGDTDLLFMYRPNAAQTESYYVSVDSHKFNEQTGTDYSANYELTFIES